MLYLGHAYYSSLRQASIITSLLQGTLNEQSSGTSTDFMALEMLNWSCPGWQQLVFLAFKSNQLIHRSLHISASLSHSRVVVVDSFGTVGHQNPFGIS